MLIRPHLNLLNLLAKMLCAALIAASSGHGAAVAADDELVSIVIVSRHGVRSPTGSHVGLATVAADPWPSWPVEPGYLTPRGEELARLLGVYYRAYYAEQGLLSAQGCPQSGEVVAWADVDQRTRVTAQALFEGMFPGCGLKVGYRVGAKADPLFSPTRAGVCRIDPARARKAVLDRIGSFTALQSKVRDDLAEMDSVLKCCGPAVCRAAGAKRPCTLGDLKTNVVAASARGARLSGPIAIGSTAAEAFLLQYAEGFPADQVAWGRVPTPEAMRPLLRLHTLALDLMERTPYLASRQGSALVQRVLATLRRAVDGGGQAPSGARSKLTLLVGHDTNLSAVGGVLGIHWSLPSYLPDQTPPGGALHFALRRDRQTGAYAVRVEYLAQTLDQMRLQRVLGRANPPEQATATIAGCVGEGGACPWTTFEGLAEKAIDPACVEPAR